MSESETNAEARDLQPRKQPQQARAVERVGRILEATADVMRRDGVAAVNTASIARQAGIPVGSIYQYFPNKQAIFLALYAAYLDGIRAAILDWRGRVGDFATPSDFFLALFADIKALERVGNLTGEISQAVRLYPDLAQEDERHGRVVADLFADLLVDMGSPLDRAELGRLGLFLYATNEGQWGYRESRSADWERDEADRWSAETQLAIVRLAFPA